MIVIAENNKKYRPDDIFPNHMAICGPPCSILLARYLERIIRFGKVIDQSVKPDIDCLRVVVRHRDPPAEPFDWP